MTAADLGRWILHRLSPLVRLTTFVTWRRNKRIVDLSGQQLADLHATWERRLEGSTDGIGNSLTVVYQQAGARISGFESKAAGLLTIAGIVAAGDLVAITGGGLAPVFAIVSAVYLLSALLACWRIYHPEQRETLLLDDVDSATEGLAEMALAARALEPVALRASNRVTAAVEDTAKAIIWVIVALVFYGVSTHVGSEGHPERGPRIEHNSRSSTTR
jgi:hypothetical protein